MVKGLCLAGLPCRNRPGTEPRGAGRPAVGGFIDGPIAAKPAQAVVARAQMGARAGGGAKTGGLC